MLARRKNAFLPSETTFIRKALVCFTLSVGGKCDSQGAGLGELRPASGRHLHLSAGQGETVIDCVFLHHLACFFTEYMAWSLGKSIHLR
jgi:hypothetical protein